MRFQDKESWLQTRQKGKLHFVLFRGILAWGLPCGILLTVWDGLERGFTINGLLLRISLLTVFGGALFGIALWHNKERRFFQDK